MIKFLQRWSVAIICLLLVSCCGVYAEEKQKTFGEYLTEKGIPFGENTEYSYVTVGEEGREYVLENEDSSEVNAVLVKNESEEGIVEEYLIIGFEDEGRQLEPVSFTPDVARTTFTNTFVPSQLSSAPLTIYVKTSYTLARADLYNPSGVSFFYSLTDSQVISVPYIQCVYEVSGKAFKGTTDLSASDVAVDKALSGWTYDPNFECIYYDVTASASYPTAEITYSATKAFPSGYYIYCRGGIGANLMVGVSGQVVTSSGTKKFSASNVAY